MLLLETFLPSSTMQHSSMNDEKVSISCRYPSVASLTSSGIFSPSFCHIRQPSTAHDNMPAALLSALPVAAYPFYPRYGNGERNQLNAPPNAVTGISYDRSVVYYEKWVNCGWKSKYSP